MRHWLLLVALLLLPEVLAGQRGGPGKPAADPAQARAQAGTAKLYDTSVLHRISVVIDEAEAPKLQRRTDERLRCTFMIDGITLKDVGVRQSGGVYHPYVHITNKRRLGLRDAAILPVTSGQPNRGFSVQIAT